MIDGKYWFPVWVHAKELLRFPGDDVLIEETISYENFEKFKTKAIIKYGERKPSDFEQKDTRLAMTRLAVGRQSRLTLMPD